MITSLSSFDRVPTEIVIRVCEAVMARSTQNQRLVHLGGVDLKCFVNHHVVGIERYMLIGPDWQAGFNLSIPEGDAEDNVYRIFGDMHVVSTPGVQNYSAFVRDMTVLSMTYSDWREESFDDAEFVQREMASSK